MAKADGLSYLPRNRKELLLWLVLVLLGAFLARFFVVISYRLAHQK